VNDRLYRSREDRLIGGVCAGVADRLDLDPSLVRVGWVLLTIFTGGAFLLLYIVMLFVVPEEPLGGIPPMPPPPGPGAVPGWQPPEAGTGTWAGPAAAASTTAAATAGDTPSGEQPAAAGWQAPGAAPTAPPQAAWVPPDQAHASRRAERAARRRQRDGTIGLIFGVLLVLLGLYFLFRQQVPDVDLSAFWPIAIIVLGALLLLRAFRFDGGDKTG
jgi:phage shock protein C